MQDQILSPYTPFLVRKQLLIKSKKENIRQFYTFHPAAIGKGAFGIVYKATMKAPPYTDRVIKVINKMFLKNTEALENQLNIMKRLDHPNVVKLYQTYQDTKYLYLVLDFCEGGQLFDRLDAKGKMNQAEARKIFVQMVKVMKYLHNQKISHRDLKAENFMFSSKDYDNIKLIDFGLAFNWKDNMRDELKSIGKNLVVGTAYYIAPEVLAKDYDERCDVWSLGILLYIIATANPPIDGDDDEEILQNVKKMKFTFNHPECQHLSQNIKDLITKILTDKNKRISIDDILNHPWMTDQKLCEQPLKLNFEKLKNFTNFSKLKKLALSFIATQVPENEIKQLGALFRQIDIDSDGFITIEELRYFAEKQKYKITEKELKLMMKAIDTDKNGKISYNQFITSSMEDYAENQEYLAYIFKQFDKDNNGKINRKELEQVLQEIGIKSITGRLVEEIIESSDKNKDGYIDFAQFMASVKTKEEII